MFSSANVERYLGREVVALCGASEDWCKAMTSTYKKESGVSTSYVRLSSAPLRLDWRPDAFSRVDVWIGGPADGFDAAASQGLLARYISSDTATMIPARYKDPSGMWFGVYTSAIGFCLNTNEIRKLAIPPRAHGTIY